MKVLPFPIITAEERVTRAPGWAPVHEHVPGAVIEQLRQRVLYPGWKLNKYPEQQA